MGEGQTIVITGATDGLGKGLATELAPGGGKLILHGRNEEKGQALLEELGPRATGELEWRRADFSSLDEVRDLADSLSGEERIDVLVNNAGIGLLGGAEESSISQVQDLFDVNLFGVMRVTNAVLPSMRQRGQGRIINISSVLGLIPAPYSAHYSASKHALEGYSESLDYETRAFNIRVSLIEPAYTRSVFEQNALEPDSPLKEYEQARADARAFLRDAMTIADQPEVVAKAVLLAATAARPGRRYPTGKVARKVSVLRRFVPAEMFDKSLRKQMRLPV